jgi:hypothetical protein
MDVHLTQMSQCLEDVEDHQEAQAADLEEGRCCCGTLVESVPVTQGPGSIFEGFEGPRSGVVIDSDDEILPVVTVEEMRVWAASESPSLRLVLPHRRLRPWIESKGIPCVLRLLAAS